MKVMVCLGIKAQSCFAFKPACNKDEGCIKILLYPPLKKSKHDLQMAAHKACSFLNNALFKEIETP